MLRHRWLIAGGKDFPFADEAVDRLYAYAQGIPRTLVILADNALLGAFLTGQQTIGADLIDQVVADRGLPDTEPAAPLAMKKRTTKARAAAGREA